MHFFTLSMIFLLIASILGLVFLFFNKNRENIEVRENNIPDRYDEIIMEMRKNDTHKPKKRKVKKVSLQEIKTYLESTDEVFDTFNKNIGVEQYLTKSELHILYNIGLPRTSGEIETINILDLPLIDNRYIKIQEHAKLRGWKQSIFIDTKTKNIMGRMEREFEEYYFKNSNLEAYLNHIYIYIHWVHTVYFPETLTAESDKNDIEFDDSEVYGDSLYQHLKEYNNDVDNGSWNGAIDNVLLG